MLIFGVKNKVISSKPVDVVCTECTRTEQRVHTFQRYFHFFWVPVFPLSRQSVLECQHCKKVTLEKELSDQRKAIVRLKAGAIKAPIYMYAGSVIIVLLVGWSYYSIKVENKQTMQFLSSPAASDVAVIEAGQGQFQLLKLIAVEGNRIRFQIGQYVYKSAASAKTAIRKEVFKESGYFSDDLFEMPMDKYKQSQIKFVKRENGH
ncbi:MAG: zinc-ribbon domain-containing protein [Bdellovibrionaceae bacterium]|nr:zinc-ribbon domain-containing protein [Bdellovibrionales bacterium]MCB9085378.1 zinc-ribbon domain-containing protein [Pseudobdellovibrionaceae bacterium]